MPTPSDRISPEDYAAITNPFARAVFSGVALASFMRERNAQEPEIPVGQILKEFYELYPP